MGLVLPHLQCQSKDLRTLVRYNVKDMSFESPRTWRVLASGYSAFWSDRDQTFKPDPILTSLWFVDDDTRQVLAGDYEALSVAQLC